MPYVKSTNYRDIPFSSETSKDEFYTYYTLEQLAEKCEACKEQLVNCRTIGVLQSKEGKFLLTDVEHPSDEIAIRVSMVYLPTPPQTMVVPYPVQIFGTLQWKKRPVVFALVLEALSINTAIRLQRVMSTITAQHLANVGPDHVVDLT